MTTVFNDVGSSVFYTKKLEKISKNELSAGQKKCFIKVMERKSVTSMLVTDVGDSLCW